MPSEDVKVVLVDEAGRESDTTYLTKHHGLSAGWKRFATEHELVKGDVLVFHMITRYVFKVFFSNLDTLFVPVEVPPLIFAVNTQIEASLNYDTDFCWLLNNLIVLLLMGNC